MTPAREVPRSTLAIIALVVTMVALAPPPTGADFSFSEEDRKNDAEHEKAQDRTRAAASVRLDPKCQAALGQRKTMIIVAEHVGSGYRTRQTSYDRHFGVLSSSLQRLGVRVFTREEIRAQVAQAEIDAYFRNDPDAALGAAKKLGPNLVLRAAISSRSSYNDFMGLPEVAVSIALSLTDSSGRVVSEASASADSYSGSDTLGMAYRLLSEQAPAVLNTLYLGFCRKSDPPS